MLFRSLLHIFESKIESFATCSNLSLGMHEISFLTKHNIFILEILASYARYGEKQHHQRDDEKSDFNVARLHCPVHFDAIFQVSVPVPKISVTMKRL